MIASTQKINKNGQGNHREFQSFLKVALQALKGIFLVI